MGLIDWSKAGTRLRRTPEQHGRNPDWNMRLQRWKVAEEYAGEELTHEQVAALTVCTVCNAPLNWPCVDTRQQPMEGAHPERIYAAGAARIADGWAL